MNMKIKTESIDLKSLIKTKGLDSNEIAHQLFPENKYPKVALKRVSNGEAELSASQIKKLANLIGMPITDLFIKERWVLSSEKSTLFFKYSNYTAELNTKTFITKVYKNNSLIYENIIAKKSIKLSEYLDILNNIIK